jgi:hypothetical protein
LLFVGVVEKSFYELMNTVRLTIEVCIDLEGTFSMGEVNAGD